MNGDSRQRRAASGVIVGCCLAVMCFPSMAATKQRVPGVVVEGSRGFDPVRDGNPVVNNLQRRTFRFFWETANPQNGIVPDRYPSPSFACTSAVGFALTAYVIGAERGYVSRSQARLRTLRTLRFLANAPQGPDEIGMTGQDEGREQADRPTSKDQGAVSRSDAAETHPVEAYGKGFCQAGFRRPDSFGEPP